jgi:hypothetical protein
MRRSTLFGATLIAGYPKRTLSVIRVRNALGHHVEFPIADGHRGKFRVESARSPPLDAREAAGGSTRDIACMKVPAMKRPFLTWGKLSPTLDVSSGNTGSAQF